MLWWPNCLLFVRMQCANNVISGELAFNCTVIMAVKEERKKERIVRLPSQDQRGAKNELLHPLLPHFLSY